MNVPPITITVVAVCIKRFAASFKNCSIWLTSSFKIAINLPDDLFSKNERSKSNVLSKVSVLKECCKSCAMFLHVTAAT